MLSSVQKSSVPDAVYNCRPLTLAPPPVSIYFPAFASFARDMNRHIESFTPQELDLAMGIVTASLSIYPLEAQRQAELRSQFAGTDFPKFLVPHPLNLSNSNTSTFTPDGAIDHPKGRFRILRVIVELTNEMGTSDYLAQAECGYKMLYASSDVSPALSSLTLLLILSWLW